MREYKKRRRHRRGNKPMEMQHVHYFVAVASTLNFTRAAEQCNVSPSALTRAIQQLEYELGGPLFHRERGNTHLSELGRMMLPYFETVEESCSAAHHQAHAVRRAERAMLKLGTMSTIGPHIISDFLVRFQAQHSDVEMRVIETSASQMIEMLSKAELEVAVVGGPREPSNSLHYLPIFEERVVIVLPLAHRLVSNDSICAADIHDEPYVSRSNCELFETVEKELFRRSVRLRHVFSSSRDDWVQAMIKAGLGLGFFPEFAVTDPDLVVRPFVEPSFKRTICLATVPGGRHSPVVGAFVQEARRYPWPKTRMGAATSDTIVLG